MNVDDILVSKDFFKKIDRNNDYNEMIIRYYKKYNEEKQSKTINDRIENMIHCNKMFMFDKYEKQKIKDFKKTNLCKDKFCNNCKKVKQALYMSKFIPELEKYKDNLYHVVLTVPNVEGKELRKTIKQMFKSFTYLINYLKLKKKIKGIDFECFGYKGAVRSLEITYTNVDYHPHIHAIVYLSNLNLDKKFINDYSYNKGKLERKFSKEEIFLQKIFYLLLNGIKVTKNNIDYLNIGYACIIDKVSDNTYYEIFKYISKMKSDVIMSYDNFKTLYEATKSVRQIQGYGIFFNMSDDLNEDEIDKFYDDIVNFLKEKEEPIEIIENLKDVISDNNYKVISRKKVYKYIRNL